MTTDEIKALKAAYDMLGASIAKLEAMRPKPKLSVWRCDGYTAEVDVIEERGDSVRVVGAFGSQWVPASEVHEVTE